MSATARSTLTYDLQKDFEPIGMISVNPVLILAKKALPADDLKGLVAWMKANPGKATLANQTAAAQVGGVLLQQMTGTEPSIHTLPGRRSGDARLDGGTHRPARWFRRGRDAAGAGRNDQGYREPFAKPLQRGAGHSDADEAGVPAFMYRLVRIFAPRSTPKDVIAKLNGAMREVLADPAVKTKFAELGLDVAAPAQQTPEGFAAFHKAEIEKWWPIIRAAGVKAE